MDIIKLIENSNSLEELRELGALPDPYDETGFYYVYYARADYKAVLPEIMGFIESGLRIYYNRYYDTGKSFTEDYLAKVKSAHCRCAVLYLSAEAVKDPVFYRLLKIISDTGCNYLSINFAINEELLSGEQIAEKYVLDPERKRLLKKLFKNEITYIDSSFSLSRKIEELNRAYRTAPMHYSLCDNFAVVDYVYDVQEENITVPSSVVIGEKEYTVKAIARGAFASCGNLKKLSFPDTLEYIGFLGDEHCEAPEESSFGDIFESTSRINITNGTFYGCKSLEEIIYPPNVKFLYKYEFCGCTSLKRLILGDCLKFCVRGDYAQTDGFFMFGEEGDDDTVLKELKVPKSVVKSCDTYRLCLADLHDFWLDAELPAENVYGYTVLKDCDSFFIDKKTTNYPAATKLVRVEYDKDWAFSEVIYSEYSGCEVLEEAILPDCVKKLSGTFSGCVSLKKVKLPRDLNFIESAFEGCISLESITLPESVMFVDRDAFLGCENLHTVISDSKYNKWLFKRRKNRLDKLLSYKHKWVFYVRLFFAYLTLPLFHPVLFLSTIFRRKELAFARMRFFEACAVENLYLKENTGGFRIKGYKKVTTDKPGYYKYIKNA